MKSPRYLAFFSAAMCFFFIGAAQADDLRPHNLADKLPPRGSVAIMGSIADDVADANSFILVDDKGEPVKIEAKHPVSFKEGEFVIVKGDLEPELYGEPRELEHATVNRLTDLSPSAGIHF